MGVGTVYRPELARGRFDAIVVGSGIGGLAAAALLGKQGRRVLVLERHYVAGGFTHTFRRPGYECIEHTPERFRLPWLRPHTPVPGLFLTGQDVVTDGLGGAVMAGVLTASAILRRNVLRDIVRRTS